MKYDVVVCGAGIVGMVMSLLLSKKGIHNVIVAPKIPAQAGLGEQYHPRIFAMSLASQRLLSELGVWDILPAERLTRVEQMQIQGDQAGHLNLSAYRSRAKQLAWIVEKGEIEAALQRALSIYGVVWYDDTLKNVMPIVGDSKNGSGRGVRQVITEKGQVITADLFIAADGANSCVRRFSGIEHHVKSYSAKGLVAQLTVEKPHRNIAFQWFSEEGILAFLPLPDTSDGHQVSMVWSCPDAIASSLEKLSEQALGETLPKRIGHLSQDVLGKVVLRSPMYAFPLTLEKTGMVSEGIALVGDAAHRVHPLAGQGLNLGLSDAVALSHVLATKEHFRCYGDLRILQRYQRARSIDIAKMRWVTDGLHTLFSHHNEVVKVVRNIGLDVLEKLPFLKQILIKKASGLE